MSVHLALRARLLDDEIDVACSRLGDRVMGMERIDSLIRVPVTAPGGGSVYLALVGSGFDAEPFGLPELDGTSASAERWPTGLDAGLHPVLNRPFACIRGCAEYYCHPSHLQERWDTVRNTLRLADLLDHALRKAGRP